MQHPKCLRLVFFFVAMIARSQSVTDSGGHIVFTDQNGHRKVVTEGTLDSQPSLSFDERQVVFVRQTPGRMTETGAGEVNQTELWIAEVDGHRPRRILTGGEFIEGPNANILIADFRNPHFSADGASIYFTAAAYATEAAILAVDVTTGKVRLLFTGSGFDVISTGKYRGFLLGIKNGIDENVLARVTYYWLLDPNGKEISRIGGSEADVAKFKGANAVR